MVVALLASLSAYAQQQDIEQVTINARTKVKKERAEFKRHAQSTETLSEDELNRNNSAYIDQTLSTMAGVQVDKRTQLGGQRIVLRGYGNDQKFNNWGVKFYWNNMPITNAEGITVLDDVDFSYVNNIEVIKGPAATMYGGGVGGVVRFYTRSDDKQGTTVTEKFLAGSFKHMQSITQVNTTGDNYSLNLNYGHIQSDGYRPHGSSLKNFVNLNGEIKLNGQQKITLFASQGYSYEKVSGQIPYSVYEQGIDEGNIAYIRKEAGNKLNSTRVGLGHIWDITKNFKNMTTLFYSGNSFDRIAAGALETSTNPNMGFRSTFQLNNDIGDFKNTIDFGAEMQVSRSQISNYRFTGSVDIPLQVSQINKGSYFRYENSQGTYFLIDKILYKPFNLTLLAGLSANSTNYNREDLLSFPGLLYYNNTDQYNKNLSFSKKYDIVITPHIALQKEWKNQIFNLSYSEGYNTPVAGNNFISATNINILNENLQPEKAKMWDFSVQGLLLDTKFDYQISLFQINVKNKLTQLTGNSGAISYTYWDNTGNQRNTGAEMSLGYRYSSQGFIQKIIPFFNISYYDFKYADFKTVSGGKLSDYTHKTVVGVPRNKYAVGLDIHTKVGLYLNNTYNYLGNVYSDFGNNNKIKGFGLFNAKLGYQKSFEKFDIDIFVMGNNLTGQKNYTFLFLGNNINDSDAGSNYPGQFTDINPGPKNAYYFTGFNMKYHF